MRKLSRENAPDVVTMYLCEIPNLILKPNVWYMFEQGEGCEKCAAYLNPQGEKTDDSGSTE